MSRPKLPTNLELDRLQRKVIAADPTIETQIKRLVADVKDYKARGDLVRAGDPELKTRRQLQDKRGKLLLRIKEIHADRVNWETNRPEYVITRGWIQALNWTLGAAATAKPGRPMEKNRKLLITKQRTK